VFAEANLKARQQTRFWEGEMDRRQQRNRSGKVPDRLPEDNQILGGLKCLLEHLTETQYSDGSERQTSTLLLFVEDGLWKARLADRAAGEQLWLSGATLGQLMDTLEDALTTGNADWRPLQGQPGQQRTRR
jgi:hypothetical protein